MIYTILIAVIALAATVLSALIVSWHSYSGRIDSIDKMGIASLIAAAVFCWCLAALTYPT